MGDGGDLGRQGVRTVGKRRTAKDAVIVRGSGPGREQRGKRKQTADPQGGGSGRTRGRGFDCQPHWGPKTGGSQTQKSSVLNFQLIFPFICFVSGSDYQVSLAFHPLLCILKTLFDA